VLQRVFACLFAAGFFAALPLYALTLQDGRVRFRCSGGTPWQCTVTRPGLFGSVVQTYAPQVIASMEGKVSYGYRSRRAWNIEFKLDGHYVKILKGESTDRAVVQLATDLEQARASGQPIERELPADGAYFLTIAIAVLFAAAGIYIVLSTRA